MYVVIGRGMRVCVLASIVCVVDYMLLTIRVHREAIDVPKCTKVRMYIP